MVRDVTESLASDHLYAIGMTSTPVMWIWGGYKAADVFRDTTQELVEDKTKVEEADLLLLSKDAKRLQELKSEGKTPANDQEAADIVANLRQYVQTSGQSTCGFIYEVYKEDPGKALYVTVRNQGADYLAGKLGEFATWILGVKEATPVLAVSAGKIKNPVQRTVWKAMRYAGRRADVYAEKLSSAMLGDLMKQAFHEVMKEDESRAVQDFLARNPSDKETIYHGGGGALTSASLAFQAVTLPQVYAPVVAQAAALPVAAVPVATAYADPVAQYARTQSGYIQHFQPRDGDGGGRYIEHSHIDPHVDLPTGPINWDGSL